MSNEDCVDQTSITDRIILRLDEQELTHRIAYAERQFECYKMRVLLNQTLNRPEVMQRFIEMMQETNDFIDTAKRKLFALKDKR